MESTLQALFHVRAYVTKHGLQLGSGMQHMDPYIETRGGMFQHAQHLRTLPCREFGDVLPELLFELMFDPWHVLAFHTDALFGPRDAYVGQEIKEEYCIAVFEALRQRSGVIAVDDPCVTLENRLQPRVELLTCDGCPVWFMPHHVQIIQWQSGHIPQSARERAFARTWAPNDENAFHDLTLHSS